MFLKSNDLPDNCCLILAQQGQQEFPKINGIEPWEQSIEQNIHFFAIKKTEEKNKQQDCSLFANSDNDNLLTLHLSYIDLDHKSQKLGSESSALLQWGRDLSSVVAKEKWQRVGLPLIYGLSLEQFYLILEGFWFGSYQFSDLKKKKEQKQPVLFIIPNKESEMELPKKLETMLWQINCETIALQQVLKLVLSPANICTPEFFSNFAVEQLASLQNNLPKNLPENLQNSAQIASAPTITKEIWGEERLKQEGMNLLLAVGQGSPRESHLLILDYQGDHSSNDHIALVGKGVCFDTGGTNLKVSTNIKGMQYDMMGGAIVYGAFYYLASTGIQANIKAYIPLVENQIGCKAIKTGDIIQSAMGPTVEINNTDAEGRLILADAIHLAVKKKPKLLLDCATLTGAAVIALGEQCGAYYSNDNQIAELFAQASRETGEDAWRMPLFRPYASFLDSPLADISNISTKSSMGGSLTAALFLEKFALPKNETGESTNSSCSWLHLDLAAWSGLDEHPSFGKNSKSMGVRLLFCFVRKYLNIS